MACTLKPLSIKGFRKLIKYFYYFFKKIFTIFNIRYTMEQKIVLPELLTVAEFAKEVDLTPPAIWKKIKKGEITPTLVGRLQHIFIDFTVYGNISVDITKKRNGMGHNLYAYELPVEGVTPSDLKAEKKPISSLRMSASVGKDSRLYRVLSAPEANELHSGGGVVKHYTKNAISKALDKKGQLSDEETTFLKGCLRTQNGVAISFE